MKNNKRMTVVIAAVLAALLVGAILLPLAARAEELATDLESAAPTTSMLDSLAGMLAVKRWWQYEPEVWKHSFREHPALDNEYDNWLSANPTSTAPARDNYRDSLERQHREMHFHETVEHQQGQAVWYSGGSGACGKPLKGYYAASRALPCGSTVSVRSGKRYVFVTILDRGPFGSSSRILDLSKAAFRELSPLGAGVINVDAYRLKD